MTTLFEIDAFIVAALTLAAASAYCIACWVARGWRAAVVFASFLPALFIWACLMLAGTCLLLTTLGILPVE